MNIVKKTSDRLLLQENNIIVYLFLLVFFIPFGWIGLMSLIHILESLPYHQTLKCDRIEPTQVNCRVQKHIIGIKSQETTFTQVTGSEIIEQEESNDDGTYKVYQIKLYTKTQSSNFGIPTTDEAGTRAIAKQINTFLANSQQQTFQITKVDQSLSEAVGKIAVLLVFFIIWTGIPSLMILGIFSSALVENWDFDKTQNQLRITQYFLIKRKTKEHSLIGQLSLQIDDSEKDSENDTLYKLNLILASGEKIIIDLATNKQKVENLGNEIAQLLNFKVEKV
jgi:hypothetical protein